MPVWIWCGFPDYAQEEIILKNICEWGHVGSWNWMEDWAQSWPGVILNELGDSRSRGQLSSLLIFNCGALSHQTLINHSFFPSCPSKGMCERVLKNKTKWSSIQQYWYACDLHLFTSLHGSSATLPTQTCRLVSCHDPWLQVTAAHCVAGFPWPVVTYLIKIGPLERIIRVMPIGPLRRVMRVMSTGPSVSHKSHARWSISDSHKSHARCSIRES